MNGSDKTEQYTSKANRQCSAADGPNLLQSAATARMNQVDRNQCGYGSMPSSESDWQQRMRDHEARDRFEHQFRLPGGSTFRRGSVLPAEGGK